MSDEMRYEDLLALNAYLVQGKSFRQIKEECGVGRGRLHALMEREDVKEILQRMRERFYVELDAMQDLVVGGIRDALMSQSMQVRLAGIDRWGRLSGKFKDNVNLAGGASAEDIAKALLEKGMAVKEGESA